MAKLTGILPLSGTIDNVTFAQTKHGIIARRRRKKIPKKVYKTAPSYREMRKNAGIMGGASTFASRLKAAFDCMEPGPDGRRWTRLIKAVGNCLRAEAAATGIEGMAGDFGLLAGFELNGNASLSSTFRGAYSTRVDGQRHQCRIDIAPFGVRDIKMPGHATHYRFAAGAIVLTAGKDKMARAGAISDWQAGGSRGGVNLQMVLPEMGKGPLLQLLGVQFAQEVNGIFYPLPAHDAMAVLELAVLELAVGSLESAVSGRQSAVGSLKLAVGSLQSAGGQVDGPASGTAAAFCSVRVAQPLQSTSAPVVQKTSGQPKEAPQMPAVVQPVHRPERKGRNRRPGVVRAQRRGRKGGKKHVVGPARPDIRSATCSASAGAIVILQRSKGIDPGSRYGRASTTP